MDNKNKKPITAIVVDDDKNTVSVFSDYLEIKGIEVVERGYDGMDALDLYKRLKPDVAFLDVMMDRYDGFYALEQIKSIDQNAIVIMVTADLTQETDNRLHELKADAIIYKPFDIDKIMQVVRKLIPSGNIGKN